jgi:phosphatidylserine/phosphatidylglycerophosphate/cardiolipin synthase-like enzyme
VQVILDPSPGFDASKESEKKKALKELRAAGVKVLFYPTTGSRGQINHVKLLIVDGKQVLMGGMNWGTHSPYNHDLDLKIEGPAVNYYEDLFAQDWKISRGPKFDRPPKAEPLPDANTPIISATTNYFRSGIERTLHGHIDEAKKSIHVEMFVMSDDETIKKLIAAHKRGVDVKVLLDPNGVRNGWNPNGETFKKLKRAGVPVKWYNVNKESREKLHGKWAVFDGQVAMAGSSNWSFKGLNINREIASFAKDEATTSIMEKQFQLDWETRAVDRKPDVP